MEKLKHAMNFISTGDESSGPTKPMGEASVPAGISEHFTRTPDKSRTERLKELRSRCASDLEYEIESSQEHWTEVETEAASDDEEIEAANREVFEHLLEQWRCPRTGLCFFHDWGENLQVGRKITEGGQAEIFEAEIEGDPGYVVKVFKKESALKDLERQWPRGMFQPQPLASSRSSVALSRFSVASSSSSVASSRSSVASWFSSIFLNWKSSIPRDVKQSRSEDKANQASEDKFHQTSEDEANQASVSTHFIFENCCFIHGATLLRNGRFAFVLERYWGDLRRYIDLQMEAGHRQPFEDGADVYIMLEIAKGMRTLHGRGILHRDLKASNILVRDVNGDLNRSSFWFFGTSRRVAVDVDVADFESSSSIVGTGFWRAPEVLSALKDRTSMRDSTPWTEKSDVYSYAMTCYEVLTGRIPFEGVDEINNDRVINGERPPWFGGSWLDSGLRTLVTKCWRANPSERPNFEEIVEILEEEDEDRAKYRGARPGAPVWFHFVKKTRENRRYFKRIFATKQ